MYKRSISRFIVTIIVSLIVSISIGSAKEVKEVYGRYERVQIFELGNIPISAKLDTGAKSASLHAVDIKRFKRGKKRWVRFTIALKGHEPVTLERPYVKTVKIKQRVEESDDISEEDEEDVNDDEEDDNAVFARRPIVQLDICLGNQLQSINVNLTDRSTFNYPLLIGADALVQFEAVVDPSRKFTHRAKCF